MRDLDKPLVVIEDEHGFKSMYWYLEPTSEDNVSHNKKRQPPARYMASFWLLVTNKAKQNEEQDDYRFRGGGTGEEIAKIWHTQNATQVGLASDKVEKAACENRNYRKAARSKPQGKNRQAITQPTYNMNRIYAICERTFREEGWSEDKIIKEQTEHFRTIILGNESTQRMWNMRSVRITPHNGKSAFNYPIVIDGTIVQALISANLAYWLLDAKMIRSSGRVAPIFGENPSRKSYSVTFDVQYEGNYTTVKAWIETTTEGQLKLGKKDLWDLGMDTTTEIIARAVEDNRVAGETTPTNEEQQHTTSSNDEDDLQDPIDTNLFKPLLKGWRREVVFRRDAKKCDIYYEAPTPEGSRTPLRRLLRKKRSPNDIFRHLKKYPDKDLQVGDFSYERKPLGILCDSYETVRNANEKIIVSSEKLGYCPIHTGFARGQCPILNITRQENGSMLWDHKTLVHRTEGDCQPQDVHPKAWDVNINTGEITQDDPLRVNPREPHASVGESESGGSEEEDRVFDSIDHILGITRREDILESMKHECLSDEDGTETFMEAYLNDRHHEEHGHTMAEDMKHPPPPPGNPTHGAAEIETLLGYLDHEDRDER